MPAFPEYSKDTPRVTHNAVFEMLSETGIPGCFFFLLMIFATIGRMFLLWLRARGDPENEALGTYCQIVMATLIVYLVPNMFINRQDFDLMYQLIAIGAGLSVVTQRRLARQHVDEHVEIKAGDLGDPSSPSDVTIPLWQRARS